MRACGRLAPSAAVDAAALDAGQRHLVLDAAFASLTGALSGGVVLVSFALALGASPLAIGGLAAIPLAAQLAQLPGIVLVERLRLRKCIGVPAITAARVVILGLALLPLLRDRDSALAWLVAAQVAICTLSSFGGSAVNAWLHQLVPRERLGRFFSRRLFWGTVLGSAGTLFAGWLVDAAPTGERMHAYVAAFALAALAGFASSYHLSRVPEPAMPDAGPRRSILAALRSPFLDAGFRRLLVFLGAWNLASNVAAPFLTVFLIRQLGYPLSVVTALWVASQAANALTLYLWGKLSDRLSNKAILAVALPLYFGCTFGLVFADTAAASPGVRLGWLALLHVAMGMASGGIGLATGNLGLKLAPQGQGAPYLAAIGLVGALIGGAAPLAAGAIADALQSSELSVLVRWVLPGSGGEFAVARFAHWEFLFALSALLGLYVMHALSRVAEGREVSERLVVQEFALEALRSVNHLSSIGGLLGNVFAFVRLSERRRYQRPP